MFFFKNLIFKVGVCRRSFALFGSEPRVDFISGLPIKIRSCSASASATKHGIGVALLRLPPASELSCQCIAVSRLRADCITTSSLPDNISKALCLPQHGKHVSSFQETAVSFPGYSSRSHFNEIKETQTSRFTCTCLPFP